MGNVIYPLALDTWGEEEKEAACDVIHSGKTTMGEQVYLFEADLAAYHGVSHAVMVNSGSSANLLMMTALLHTQLGTRRLQPGDEILVPAVSWATTYYPVTQCGFKLRFVDVSPSTMNMDVEAAKEAITYDTRAILMVNLLGNPNHFGSLNALAEDNNLVLLEDNCESLGASYVGKKAGTFGLMGTLSFFFSHHISTMEGGAILTNDPELAQLLRSLRAHGWTRGIPPINYLGLTISDDPFEEKYKFVYPGYNVRPMEVSGAIGRQQMKKFPGFLEARKKNAEYFLQKIQEIWWITPQYEVGTSSWFGFGMRVHPCKRRNDVVALLESKGIETRPIVGGNFVKNPVVEKLPHSISGDLAGAKRIDKTGFFVGNHHFPIEKEIDYLIDTLHTLD